MERRSSRVFIIGLVLLVLGIGNWVVGGYKIHQYRRRAEIAYRRGGPDVHLPYRGTASILEPTTPARDLYEASRVKYEQYRVVHRGGRMLTILGVLMVLGALARRWAVPSH